MRTFFYAHIILMCKTMRCHINGSVRALCPFDRTLTFCIYSDCIFQLSYNLVNFSFISCHLISNTNLIICPTHFTVFLTYRLLPVKLKLNTLTLAACTDFLLLSVLNVLRCPLFYFNWLRKPITCPWQFNFNR